MAQQIVKKFIQDGAVDGEKLLLEQGQSVRIQDGANVINLVSYVDGKVHAAGDEVALAANLAAETTARETAINGLASDLNGAVSSLDNDISLLDGRLDVIEGTGEGSIAKAVADLVNSAPAALDTLKELADAIQAGETVTDGLLEQIGQVAIDLQAHEDAVTGAHAATAISLSIVGITATDVQAGLSEIKGLVETAQDAAEAAQADVDTLEGSVTTLQGTVSGIESDVTALETSVATLQSESSDYETRITALEGQGDGPAFHKAKFVLGSGDLSYINLSHEAIGESLVLSIGRLMAHPTDDYTLSVVGGVTRVTWAGDFADAMSEMKLEAGDVAYVTYAVQA